MPINEVKSGKNSQSADQISAESSDHQLQQRESALEEKANAEHVRKIIHDIPVAMLTTTDWSGQLRSRPMAIQQVDGDDKLYLLTSEDSGKILAIRTDQNVNVVCADRGSNCYLSVCGAAQIVQDRKKIRELWNPTMKAWFPDGPETPEICLIVISVEEAEFWDAPLGKWIQMIKVAKAALSGRRYEASQTEHGEIHPGDKH